MATTAVSSNLSLPQFVVRAKFSCSRAGTFLLEERDVTVGLSTKRLKPLTEAAATGLFTALFFVFPALILDPAAQAARSLFTG